MEKDEEAVDELTRYGLKLIQPCNGYRYSLDPLLLCSFVQKRLYEKVIDLGTGCGIIPHLLARRNFRATVIGVEIQPELAEFAKRNVAMNSLGGQISIVQDDILNLRRSFPVSSFDLVISNPPYRCPGTGRVSPKAGRDLARHESTASLPDFLAAAKYLAKPGGSICFVYHPSRLAEFIVIASELKLSLVRLRMVHGRVGSDARIFLAELAKGRKAQLEVEPPLVIYGEDGVYTEEAEGILG